MRVNRSEMIEFIKKNYLQGQNNKADTSNSSGPPAAEDKDRVELSSSMKAEQQGFSEQEKIDNARKVEEVSRRVQEGTYEINSRELAEIMLKYIDNSVDE